MVPAPEVELTYGLPDFIASLSEEELAARCRYTEDCYVCDDKYFYIRGVLPLPVFGYDDDYCLGVWVQVSGKGFKKAWELQGGESQADELPLKGLLANKVHLNTLTENAEVTVQLMGATSRPVIRVVDSHCSLFEEQQNGITLHRANEYSNLGRKV